MSMLSQLANVFAIVESVAVTATLIAIFFQLRQTRKITISGSYQNLTATYNSFLMSIALDEQLHSLYMKGRERPRELSNAEKSRFVFLCAQIFSFHEQLYILHRAGLLPNQLYDGWNNDLLGILGLPGFVAYWKEQEHKFVSSFRTHMDRLLDDIEIESARSEGMAKTAKGPESI
jgi:hypothetical protein